MESVKSPMMRDLTEDELLLVSGGYSSEYVPFECVYPLPWTPDWDYFYFITYDNDGDVYGGSGGGISYTPPAEEEVVPPPPPPTTTDTATDTDNYQYGGEGWDPATVMVAIP